MATFGPVSSPFANVLYNPMAVDQAVQGQQRNRLMMEHARQDQGVQMHEKDVSARIGMARELSALPEQEAASQWGSYRQRLQSAGLGQGLPEQFPGLERLKAVASSDLTTFQRMQIEERRRGSEALMGLLGGGVSAAPGGMTTGQSAPAAAPGVPVRAPDGNMYGRNAPAEATREALLDQPPVVLAAASSARAAQSGLPTNAPYQDGATWAAGIAPPTGAVPALGPSSAPAARPAAAPASPAGPALLPNGLTQQQAAQLAVIGQSNPQAAIQQMGAYQQQNRMAQERAQDDARQQQQRAEDLELRRGAETRAEAARREAADAARRREEAEDRKAQTLPPALVEMRQETEDRLAGLQSARSALDQALELSKKAYAGRTATIRGEAASMTGVDTAAGTATRQLNSIMTEQALGQLRSIFGGNPTEGERKILLEMQASANMPQNERDALIARAQQAVRVREGQAQTRLTEIRTGTYGRVDPNYQPPAAPPQRQEGGGGASADPLEGRTITNGTTGERMIRRNGKWEAM